MGIDMSFPEAQSVTRDERKEPKQRKLPRLKLGA